AVNDLISAVFSVISAAFYLIILMGFCAPRKPATWPVAASVAYRLAGHPCSTFFIQRGTFLTSCRRIAASLRPLNAGRLLFLQIHLGDPMSKLPETLRENVRLLGELLGETIHDHEGPEVFAKV